MLFSEKKKKMWVCTTRDQIKAYFHNISCDIESRVFTINFTSFSLKHINKYSNSFKPTRTSDKVCFMFSKVNVGKLFYLYYDGWLLSRHNRINNDERSHRDLTIYNWAIENIHHEFFFILWRFRRRSESFESSRGRVSREFSMWTFKGWDRQCFSFHRV